MRKEIIISHLLRVCQYIINLSRIPLNQIAKIWFPVGVALSVDGLRAYNDAIKEIFQDRRIVENFTRREVVKKIDDILLQCYALSKSEGSKTMLQKLNNWNQEIERELNKIQKWQFLIPIENMMLKERKSFSLGKVKFYPFSVYRRRQWIKDLKDILAKSPHYNDKEKDSIIKSDRDLLSRMEGKIYAEIYVKGRLERARELALQQVRLTLGVLKLYWTHLDDKSKRYFGISNEVIPKKIPSETSLVLAKTPRQMSYLPFGFPTLFNFEIDEERIYWMKGQGINKFDEILKKDYPSYVESKLLAAIYWFAKAVDIPPVEVDEEKIYYIQQKGHKLEKLEFFNMGDRFLKLMIALEALLVLDRNEPLKANISERGALIAGREYGERKEIKKKLKDFYDIRSDMVHRGESAITNSQVIELMNLTRKIIVTMARNLNRWKISSKEDIREWFERAKLS